MKHNFKILTDEYWKRFSDSGICSLSDYPIPLTFSFQIYKTKSSLENSTTKLPHGRTDGDAESLCESLSSRCPPSMKNSSKPARDMGLQTGGQGGQQGRPI